MKAELERLRAENAKLKSKDSAGLSLKVSEKGAVSLYGMGCFPVTLYPKCVYELDSSREIVVHCKSGMRSVKAVDFLCQSGFNRVTNLTGGILAWAEKVDPSLPKY